MNKEHLQYLARDKISQRKLLLPGIRAMTRALFLVAAVTLANAANMRLLESTALCPDCLKEPLEPDYWPRSRGSEPPRLSAAHPDAREMFDAAVKAGKVLILENATDGTALAGWSCEKMAEELPNARMRREYDWERQHLTH